MSSYCNSGFNLTSGRFSDCGEVDLYVGSEPRKFISFRLDKETDGHLSHTEAELEPTPGTSLSQIGRVENLTAGIPSAEPEAMDTESTQPEAICFRKGAS